jgi:hypothetical protein
VKQTENHSLLIHCCVEGCLELPDAADLGAVIGTPKDVGTPYIVGTPNIVL